MQRTTRNTLLVFVYRFVRIAVTQRAWQFVSRSLRAGVSPRSSACRTCQRSTCNDAVLCGTRGMLDAGKASVARQAGERVGCQVAWSLC